MQRRVRVSALASTGRAHLINRPSLARLLSPSLRRPSLVVSKQYCWSLQKCRHALGCSDSPSPRCGWEILLIRVEVLQLPENNWSDAAKPSTLQRVFQSAGETWFCHLARCVCYGIPDSWGSKTAQLLGSASSARFRDKRDVWLSCNLEDIHMEAESLKPHVLGGAHVGSHDWV